MNFGELWKYEFDTNNWINNQIEVPIGNSYVTTCYNSLDNIIFVFGGSNLASFMSVFNVTNNTFLNNEQMEQNGFIQLNNSDLLTRDGKCVYDNINNIIYYLGGFSYYSGDNQNLMYDIHGAKWESLDTAIECMSDCSIVKIGREIWIFGGYSGETGFETDIIQIFNLDTQITTYANYDGQGVVLYGQCIGVSGV